MKILLVGEFSGFYSTLKAGLLEHGHEVKIASTGDSWRKISNDIELIPRWMNSKIFNLHRYFLPAINQNKLFGHEIVQFINPAILSPVNIFNSHLGRKIIERSEKSFLSACGDDYYYYKNRGNLKYNPLDDSKRIDFNGKKLSIEYKWYKKWNIELAKKVNGIIPVMYEYSQAYKNIENISLRKSIALPVDLKKVVYVGCGKSLKKKISIFHGLNREGFKGTKYIREAFLILEKRYAKVATFTIEGKIPYGNYIDYLAQFDIVIDQVNSYSSGMNGIIAMALGKVVVGGAEEESLQEFNLTSSPIINIKPNVNDIVDKISNLIDNKINLEAIGFSSRQFAVNNHCSLKIAAQYIEEWKK